MTTPHPLTPQLAQMPALAELFRLFLSGKHLNRMAELMRGRVIFDARNILKAGEVRRFDFDYQGTGVSH